MEMFYQLLLIAFPAVFAGILHMVVVKYNVLPILSLPLDHNKTFRGKRIFGRNKTYRGLIFMIVFSITAMIIYHVLFMNNHNIAVYNLFHITPFYWLFYGVLYGFGYVVGELPNSFVKRQLEIAPGKNNGFVSKLVDQLDSVIAILILLLFFSRITWNHFFWGLIFFGFLHLVINLLLYLGGVRKEPF